MSSNNQRSEEIVAVLRQALENELSASDFIDKAPQSWDKTERTEWARLQAMYHNIRLFKKAMRQAIADFEKQDKFCDDNCVWTDHHKDCVRSDIKQKPVAWMHPDGRIWTFGRGFDKSTFTIPLYTHPYIGQPRSNHD
jgi:hypothetical protein